MIAIIDYGIGNVGSILNMSKHIGAKVVLSSDSEVLGSADKLILPGVGAFDAGMRNLMDARLIEVLTKLVIEDKKPVLGICLGMQMLGTSSEEGKLPGLSWINFRNVKFRFSSQHELKLPHMGWNLVKDKKESPLLYGLDLKPRFYFVHTYHAICEDKSDELLESTYGYPFISAVERENIYGVQFHPEKSHKFGMQLLKNFAERC